MSTKSKPMMPKVLCSASDLLEIIRTRNTDFWHTRLDKQGNLIIDNIHISEKLVIDNLNLTKGIIIGRNTQFEEFQIKGGEFESFTIQGGEFNGPFLINDGIFKKYFRILGGTFNQGLQISGGQFQGSVFFQGGEFHKLFRIVGGAFNNSPHISGGLFTSEVRVEKGEFGGRFQISGGEFKNDLDIWGGQFKFMFEITNGIFERFVNIVGGEFMHFNIEGGQFHRTLQVVGGKFKKSFKFQKGEYNCPIDIENGQFRLFQITSGNYNKPVKIKGGKFEEFNISGGQFNDDFWIEGGEFTDSFLISSAEFNTELNILDGTFSKGIAIVGGLFNDRLVITGGECLKTLEIVGKACIHHLILLRSIGDQVLYSIKIDKISMLHYLNSHSLKLMAIQPYKSKSGIEFNIKQSSLGNTEIIGCDWQDCTLTVDDSKIIDCYYTDTTFPQKIHSREKDIISNSQQVRDTYSQLKTMADKQNDRQLSLYFQAKSNEQILRHKKESIKRAFKFQKPYSYGKFKRNLWEWAQLGLSQFSNDFGNSYSKAGWNILIFGSLFFCLYLPCVDQNLAFTRNFTQWWSGFAYGFSNHFGDFLGFLNPARRYKYMSCIGSNCHPQWALVIDWISRIFLAFFFYGFIQAFRKYGKK